MSRIAHAYLDRVEVRGRDPSGDLMGRLGFTEYFHRLLTGREPSEDERAAPLPVRALAVLPGELGASARSHRASGVVAGQRSG